MLKWIWQNDIFLFFFFLAYGLLFFYFLFDQNEPCMETLVCDELDGPPKRVFVFPISSFFKARGRSCTSLQRLKLWGTRAGKFYCQLPLYASFYNGFFSPFIFFVLCLIIGPLQDGEGWAERTRTYPSPWTPGTESYLGKLASKVSVLESLCIQKKFYNNSSSYLLF